MWLLKIWSSLLTRQAWFKSVIGFGTTVLGIIGALNTISDFPETIAKDRTFFRIADHALLETVSVPLGFLLLLAVAAIPLVVISSIVILILKAFGRAKWIEVRATFFSGGVFWACVIAALYLDMHYGTGPLAAFKQYEDNQRFHQLHRDYAKQYNDSYRSCLTGHTAEECSKDFPLYPLPLQWDTSPEKQSIDGYISCLNTGRSDEECNKQFPFSPSIQIAPKRVSCPTLPYPTTFQIG